MKKKKYFIYLDILGIHEDLGYLDFRKEGIEGIVNCLLEKLANSTS